MAAAIVADMLAAQGKLARLARVARTAHGTPDWWAPWRRDLAQAFAVQHREVARCGAMLAVLFPAANDPAAAA